MKKYLQALIIGITIAATAFAVGSQPSAASADEDCGAGSCCTPCCQK